MCIFSPPWTRRKLEDAHRYFRGIPKNHQEGLTLSKENTWKHLNRGTIWGTTCIYGSTITQCLAHVLLENQSCKVKLQINLGKLIKKAEIFKVTAIQRPHHTCCILTEYGWRQLLHRKLLLIGSSHWTTLNKIQWTRARSLHPLRVLQSIEELESARQEMLTQYWYSSITYPYPQKKKDEFLYIANPLNSAWTLAYLDKINSIDLGISYYSNSEAKDPNTSVNALA